MRSLAHLDRDTPIYAYCLHEELFDWIKALGFRYVHSLQLNVTVKIGPFMIQPKRALDADVDSIFHIRAMGLNILNVVDSWIDDETMLELTLISEWHMILWPFQILREIEVLSPAKFSHVSRQPTVPSEWLDNLQLLRPQILVPSSCQFIHESWSWYNSSLFAISYEQFQREVKTILANTEIVKLNPGTSVKLMAIEQHHSLRLEPAQPLPWIKPIGPQDVDYHYDSTAAVPTTAAIAQNFPALSSEKILLVYDYCREGLLKRYQSLDPLGAGAEVCLNLWQLVLYQHDGSLRSFTYKINLNCMSLLNESNVELNSSQPADSYAGPLMWRTEIAITKLYSALMKGEAMTSLYLRIHSPESTDVLDDPLVRCLYSGVFGAYQKHQLHELRTVAKLNSTIAVPETT